MKKFFEAITDDELQYWYFQQDCAPPYIIVEMLNLID